jgi:hypothetical protein
MWAMAENRSGGGPVINLNLSGNDFGPQKGHLDGPILISSNVNYRIDYEANDTDLEVCYKDLFVTNDSVQVDFLVPDYWYHNGHYLTYDDLGQVQTVGHSKKYCDSQYWIVASFELTGDIEDEFNLSNVVPTVSYGSASGSLTSTANVCWNSNIDKWIAEMNVPSFQAKRDTVYWAASVTICDSTGTSVEQSHIYDNTWGACKDPLFCD